LAALENSTNNIKKRKRKIGAVEIVDLGLHGMMKPKIGVVLCLLCW